MSVLAAAHALLSDGPGWRVAPARVHVEGARIVAVEPDAAPQPGDDRLGQGRLLTPAFVDAHTHLALVGLRGLGVDAAASGDLVRDLFFRIERAMSRDDVRAFAAVGATEALLGGVAVAWDHYYAADAVLEACRDVGLAAVVAPALQDLDGPGMHTWEAALDLTERLAADPTLPALGCGVAVGPHAVDTVSDALWERVAALAARLDLPVHTHVAQSPGEVRRVQARSGRTPVAHLHALGVLGAGPAWRLVHALWATEAELALLAAEPKVELVACPLSSGWFGFPPPVDRWTAHGLRWAVATDGSASFEGASPRAQLSTVAGWRTAPLAWSEAIATWRSHGEGLDAVVSARTQRRLDTQDQADPAALLGRVTHGPGHTHPRLPSGTIAAGQLAHLALWDLGHPAFWPGTSTLAALAFGAVEGALDQVMVAGRWIGMRGDYARSVVTAGRRWAVEAAGRRARLMG